VTKCEEVLGLFGFTAMGLALWEFTARTQNTYVVRPAIIRLGVFVQRCVSLKVLRREQCGHKAQTGCRMWVFAGVVLVSLQAFFVKQRNFDFL
jgi:hypothetical protein|tara:strand:- start:182 stop:460 length:279 start_codon:yes stop_codon:yes gene_type:complete